MLEISVHNARDLCESDWYELQHISRDAFNNDLDRPANEIDTLVSWNDRERYYQSHTNPNSEVGEAFNAGQEYRYPKVAVARETGLTVGFAYSAHNVSGPNEMIRDFKRLSIVKNYLWLREVVVHPDYRGQNIALGLCKALLSDETTIPAQPVSTYIWPSEMPNLQPRLEGLGFKEKGTQNVNIFGPTSSIVQKMMVAHKAQRVLMNLERTKS